MARYAVVDVEATGAHATRGAVLLEVAAVLLEDGRPCGEFSTLVRGAERVPEAITALTGIDAAMLARAPAAEDALSALARFAAGATFVAHSAFHDHAHLHKAYGAVALPAPRRERFVCTLQLARRLYPGLPSHKLYALAEALALGPAPTHHRALADARLTARLFAALCAALGRQLDALAPGVAVSPGLLLHVARSRARRLDACLAQALSRARAGAENAAAS